MSKRTGSGEMKALETMPNRKQTGNTVSEGNQCQIDLKVQQGFRRQLISNKNQADSVSKNYYQLEIKLTTRFQGKLRSIKNQADSKVSEGYQCQLEIKLTTRFRGKLRSIKNQADSKVSRGDFINAKEEAKGSQVPVYHESVWDASLIIRSS